MGKSRFVADTASIDKAKLRLRRKEVLGYSIFAILFAKVPQALIDRAGGYNTFTLMHIIAGILFIFVIIAFIQGIRTLYKLTKTIYTKPVGYFIAYLLLVFLGGFVLGFFAIFGLASIWYEVRKCLITPTRK